MKKHTKKTDNVIDFGGGSGAFLRGLSHMFNTVEVIDLDPVDASKLKTYHRLDNVEIYQGNIQDWNPEKPRDVVVATDVLEHFQDLTLPIQRIKSYLKPNGLLCFSVPTENWLYLLGRLIVRKTKPLDHFHDAKTIVEVLKDNNFQPVWESFAPKYGIEIPLFHLGIYKNFNTL